MFSSHDRKKIYLTKIQHLKGDHVIFGDGDRGKIIEKGQLCVKVLPHLDDVLFVEGLTANLISIKQLYDDDTVNNSCDQTVMKGVRSADNCYM
ncbi:hypothetical protein LIER_43158 [Lithospermum erythrorhizon]|uniref:Retrovirus-related Pol polyprotein from transposon TNT 1-94-like beta-barrel domain-containing protein n=1 Tax=Lithospermum erythrorhizon TaxID=34254 RepID=A0AAV3PL59_LITER